MIALDLFCGAGGVSMGLHQAGMAVLGVDHEPQPRYPFEFMCADAFDALEQLDLSGIDFIWASPPCEFYSRGALQAGTNDRHPDLIGDIRERLIATRKPFVIENIELARPLLRAPIMLCGTMFDLGVFRHRFFEINRFEVIAPEHPEHAGKIGDGRYFTVTGKPGGRSRADGWEGGTTEQWREAMGIDWMTSREIVKAVPPAYSEFIARSFLPPHQPQRSSMGVNAPHPNDGQVDEAAAFFGEPEESAVATEPESTSDPRTLEERREDAFQYKQSHGEPISAEEQAAHDAYVASAEKPEAAVSEDVPDAVATQERLRAIAQREAAETAQPEAEEPQAAAEPEPAEEQAQAATDVSDASAEAQPEGGSTSGKKSGDLQREYIVFQRLPLTAQRLKALLVRIEEGSQPDPVIAWVELDRGDARNVNGAVAKAYTTHQERLGEKADLAAVSSRSFQVKHVEPKQRVETNLSIT